MAGSSVKFNKDVWERVKRLTAEAGYSSPEEFVQHVVERELNKLETADSKASLVDKLKGLGYLE